MGRLRHSANKGGRDGAGRANRGLQVLSPCCGVAGESVACKAMSATSRNEPGERGHGVCACCVR